MVTKNENEQPADLPIPPRHLGAFNYMADEIKEGNEGRAFNFLKDLIKSEVDYAIQEERRKQKQED